MSVGTVIPLVRDCLTMGDGRQIARRFVAIPPGARSMEVFDITRESRYLVVRRSEHHLEVVDGRLLLDDAAADALLDVARQQCRYRAGEFTAAEQFAFVATLEVLAQLGVT